MQTNGGTPPKALVLAAAPDALGVFYPGWITGVRAGRCKMSLTDLREKNNGDFLRHNYYRRGQRRFLCCPCREREGGERVDARMRTRRHESSSD